MNVAAWHAILMPPYAIYTIAEGDGASYHNITYAFGDDLPLLFFLSFSLAGCVV